jgi:hypothetical protein
METHLANSIKTDTSKLSEVESEILEKAEELRTLCSKHKRQLLVLVDAKDHKDGNYFTFWNLSNSELDEIKSHEDHAKLANLLLKAMNQIVEHFTYGQACIQRVENE